MSSTLGDATLTSTVKEIGYLLAAVGKVAASQVKGRLTTQCIKYMFKYLGNSA